MSGGIKAAAGPVGPFGALNMRTQSNGVTSALVTFSMFGFALLTLFRFG